ncbi:MAG: helix-turn-helix domain-containing protein [Gemmatimonas sp.]|nr:helix-turn-helix domain-containing protein [Gemmatimonas sp.]
MGDRMSGSWAALYDREVSARQLRSLRANRGLTQGQLARLTGITQGALSNYEASKRDLPLPTLIKLSTVLQVAPAAIVPALIGMVDSGQRSELSGYGAHTRSSAGD